MKLYSFFPRRTEQIQGDHYIAIGNALNEINKSNVQNEQQQVNQAKPIIAKVLELIGVNNKTPNQVSFGLLMQIRGIAIINKDKKLEKNCNEEMKIIQQANNSLI